MPNCNGKYDAMNAVGQAYHVKWCKAHDVHESDVTEFVIPDTIRELLESVTHAGGDIAPEVVNVLPEHHDPIGDVLPFHVPSGHATQVLGTRPIDEGRYPNVYDPFTTDSRGRALPIATSMARIRVMREAIDHDTNRDDSHVARQLRKWDARLTGISASR